MLDHLLQQALDSSAQFRIVLRPAPHHHAAFVTQPAGNQLSRRRRITLVQYDDQPPTVPL